MAISTDKMLRLTGFVLGSAGQPFSWGGLDCNTFAATANDILTGNKTLGKIQFQYSDAISAMRFQRNFLSARQYLYNNGWREVADGNYQDGDMLICDDKHWSRAHVVFNNQAWSVHEQFGVCGGHISSLPEFTHWRLP